MPKQNEIFITPKTILLPNEASYPAGSRKTTNRRKTTADASSTKETEFWNMQMFWLLMEERYKKNVSKLGRNASIPKSTMHSIVRGDTIPNLRELAGMSFALELDADPFYDMFIRGYLERAQREMGMYLK